MTEGALHRRWRNLVGLMALAYFLLLWTTAEEIGFTRDEGYYFKASSHAATYLENLFSHPIASAFSDRQILQAFGYNREHPPLVKYVQALCHGLTHRWLGFASAAQGFRAAGFFFGALSLVATYLLGTALVSQRVGVLAALLLVSLPRYFYDAHLACFDVPMAAMWTLSIHTFYRAMTAPPHKRVVRGLGAAWVFGLALLTKLNALFLPLLFVAFWLATLPKSRWPQWGRGVSGGKELVCPRPPWVLTGCLVGGVWVFFAGWPYLWHHSLERVAGYLAFHLHHEHYPVSWFHTLLVKPPFPWSFPWLMTLFTVPLPIFVMAFLGFGRGLVDTLKHRDRRAFLLVATAFFPMLLISLPSTPIFGGVKHWYNAMPALMVLAASAMFSVFEVLRRTCSEVQTRALTVVAILLTVCPGFLAIAETHPHGISYYSETVGGVRGAASLGLQRGFWGGLARPLYPHLFQTGGALRAFFNRTNYESYLMYRKEGQIPHQIQYAREARGADIGIHFAQPEHGEAEGAIWSNLGTRPVHGVYLDEVTLVQGYDRKASRGAPAAAP